MNEPTLEQLLEAELAFGGSLVIGEVAIRAVENGGFELTHRKMDVPPREESSAGQALDIARFDDAGAYRPLRTAPNLRRDWKINVGEISELLEVVEVIYPARLAAWRAWKLKRLVTTPLRASLNRQSGMYRIAAKITDDEINELIGNFCRSDGGCLRTILWRRDYAGRVPSTKLPAEKFAPATDQYAVTTEPQPVTEAVPSLPLLCQEACNLLVAACRDVVKASAPSSG